MRGKERFDHQNEYNKQRYDRIGIMIPKGQGDIWKAFAESKGVSLSAMIQQAVKEYMEKIAQ